RWKKPREHHWLDLAVARKRARRSSFGGRDRVAHPTVYNLLDRRDHVAHRTGGQLLGGSRPRREPPHLVDLVDLARVHHPDLGARLDLAVHDADVGDDAAVRVVVRVEDQRAQRRRGIAARRRHLRDDRLQDVLGADALLGGSEYDVLAWDPGDVRYLLGHELRLRGVEVD